MFLDGTINELSPKNVNKNAQKSANFAETMGFKSTLEYYDINMTTKSSFWVEKVTKYHLKKTPVGCGGFPVRARFDRKKACDKISARNLWRQALNSDTDLIPYYEITAHIQCWRLKKRLRTRLLYYKRT